MSNKNASKPVKPRQKTLNLKNLEKQFNDLNKRTTFVVDEETNTVIKYNEKFDEVKIQELFKTAYEHLIHVEENDLNFLKTDEEFIQYIQFLTILKFSNLGDEISYDFETCVNVMDWVVSTGLFHLFYQELFDGNEVIKILDRLEEYMKAVNEVYQLEKKTKKEMLEKVENEEILNRKVKSLHTLNKPLVDRVDKNGDI